MRPGFPTTPFDLSGSLGVGDPVTGLGNALGRDGAPVSASGTVTSLDETIFVEDEDATIVETLDGVVCFNAPIQPGDSGGPLLEASGRVIGMDTAGALSTAHRGECEVGVCHPDHASDDDRAARSSPAPRPRTSSRAIAASSVWRSSTQRAVPGCVGHDGHSRRGGRRSRHRRRAT